MSGEQPASELFNLVEEQCTRGHRFLMDIAQSERIRDGYEIISEAPLCSADCPVCQDERRTNAKPTTSN